MARNILQMALPMTVAQLINILYNIVDRMYLGRLPGHLSLTGLGLCLPIISILMGFANLCGMGGAPLCSIHRGKGENEEAERILGNSFTLLLLFGGGLTVFCLAFRRPILYLFGASDLTFPYANDYLTIYLLGTLFVWIGLGMYPFLNAQGFSRMGMMTVALGAAVNIVLDPIFIFLLDWGVQGAALATILSQAVSACWVFGFLCSRHSGLRIRWSNLRPSARVIGRIASLGVAPFIMQSTESLVTVVLNTGLQTYGGDLYVGALTIMQSVMQMIVMPVQGITQGTQPIMSYNYGAGNYARVRRTFQRLLTVTLTATCSAFLAVILFPGLLARIFTPQEETIQLVSQVMPLFFGGIWAFGAQMACQITFMSLGQARTSLFLALLRKVILLVPLALLLPRITGSVFGIFAAEPIADILASATTLTLFLRKRKSLLPVSSGETSV